MELSKKSSVLLLGIALVAGFNIAASGLLALSGFYLEDLAAWGFTILLFAIVGFVAYSKGLTHRETATVGAVVGIVGLWVVNLAVFLFFVPEALPDVLAVMDVSPATYGADVAFTAAGGVVLSLIGWFAGTLISKEQKPQ